MGKFTFVFPKFTFYSKSNILYLTLFQCFIEQSPLIIPIKQSCFHSLITNAFLSMNLICSDIFSLFTGHKVKMEVKRILEGKSFQNES